MVNVNAYTGGAAGLGPAEQSGGPCTAYAKQEQMYVGSEALIVAG